jgi:hypothetical protein
MAQETVTIFLNSVGQTGGLTSFLGGLNQVKLAADGVTSKLYSVESIAKRALTPLVSIFTVGALARGFKQTTDAADDMGKAAAKAGEENVAAFSQIVKSAELADVGLDAVTAGAKGLAEWMQKTGQTGRDFTTVLLEQANIFASMPSNLDRTALARERFGKSGQEMIPFLIQGSAEIKRQMERVDAFGLTVGPKFAENAQQFNDNLKTMGFFASGILNQVVGNSLPGIVDAQNKFLGFLDAYAGKLKGVVEQLGKIKTLEGTAVSKAFNWFMNASGARVSGAGAKSEQTSIGGIGTPMDKVDMARFDLEKNSLAIAEARAQTNISEDKANKAISFYLKERLPLLEKELQAVDAKADLENKTLGPNNERTKEGLDLEKQRNAILEQQMRIRKELSERNPDDFFERLSKGLDEISGKFDNVAASIADVLLTGVKGAIDTVSFGIWQVIDGTATWGQLFMQVGRNIISQLIQIAIQEILVDNLKRSIAVTWAAFKKLLMAQDVAATNASEAAKTPALAANATLASVESWGLAVAIGVAAIAAILAGVGAFEEGGVVSGGQQLIRVNESGTESVLNAMATRNLGTRMIDMMNAGAIGAAEIQNGFGSGLVVPSASSIESGSGGATAAGGKMTFIFVSNLEEAKEWAKSAEGEAMIVDIVRNKRMEVGIKT